MYVYTELGEKIQNGRHKAGEPAMIGLKRAEDRPYIAIEWENDGLIEWREDDPKDGAY